ncbi:MAG TPA: hypothetical protein PK765_07830 [bacterium]|nr:hypothetical protein [bacterium]HRI36900.1 hypothetical protein [bacterium]
MHEQIVRECERLLADESRRSLGDDVLAKLNREVSRFDSLNFSLAYDIESIEGNVENLESRIETLGATESRYFDNFVRKAKATLRSYEKAVSKNTLVKETVLESARRAAERESELRRARIDRDRVDHIKNIKELLGGFAVIEVFINGIAQAAVIFSFPDSVRTALESTDLLRMIFLSMFLVGYFARFLIVRRRGF